MRWEISTNLEHPHLLGSGLCVTERWVRHDAIAATFACHMSQYTTCQPFFAGQFTVRKKRAVLKEVHFRPRRSPVDSSVGASSLETRFRWFLAEILWPGLLRSRKHQSPSGGERSYISRQRLLILFRLFQHQRLLVHRFNSLRIQLQHSFASFEPLQKRVSNFFNEIIEMSKCISPIITRLEYAANWSFLQASNCFDYKS